VSFGAFTGATTDFEVVHMPGMPALTLLTASLQPSSQPCNLQFQPVTRKVVLVVKEARGEQH
jgi:hypothetical protein